MWCLETVCKLKLFCSGTGGMKYSILSPWQQVPDVYPILKFPEVKRVVHSNQSTDSEESVEGGGVRGKGLQQQIQLDQVEDEFQQLVAQRLLLNTVGTSLKLESGETIRKTQSMEK